jgi:hypothetical protein
MKYDLTILIFPAWMALFSIHTLVSDFYAKRLKACALTCSFHVHMQTRLLLPRSRILHMQCGNRETTTKHFPCHCSLSLDTPTRIATHSDTTVIAMSSARRQQEQDPKNCACSSHDHSVATNAHVKMPASEQKEDKEHDLVSQTANLDLKDQKTDLDISNNDATDTWSDEDAPSRDVDEEAGAEVVRSPAATPMNAVETDQEGAAKGVNDAEDGTALTKANTETEQDDEKDTPRFQTYLKLHNDASFP